MPDRVRLWRDVYAAGRAGDVCDQIVRNRPVPRALLMMLERGPRLPACGTLDAYKAGCRCEPCRVAKHAEYVRYRDRATGRK